MIGLKIIETLLGPIFLFPETRIDDIAKIKRNITRIIIIAKAQKIFFR